MMRFLSILLLLAGLVVAGYGGASLLEAYSPKDGAAVTEASVQMDEPPAEKTVAPASVPSSAARALPAPSLDGEPVFSGEAVPMEAPDASAAFLKSLKTVPVAHETPATAEYKRPFEAVLAIDATGDDTAVDALPGRGNIEEGTAKVSKKVEARLSGSGFAITAMTPEQQTISPLTENTWRWSVTPLTAGNQELTFDIYAIDDGPAVPLRTFHNTVTVQVTGLNRAIAFADQANPLAVFLGGVGSVLAGLIGAFRFVRKR